MAQKPKDPPLLETKPRPLGARLKRLLVVSSLAVLLLLLLVKFVVGPAVICQVARDLMNRELNGRFDVKWASFGYRTLELEGVQVFDAEGKELGDAEGIVVRFDRPFLGFGDIHVEEVTLIRPTLVLRSDPGGSWNLQRILERPAPPPVASTEPPPPAGKPQRVQVRTLEKVRLEDARLQVETGRFSLVFHALEGEIAVEPRQFVVKKLEGLAYGGRVALTGRAGTGSDGSWSAQLNVSRCDVIDLCRTTFLRQEGLSGDLEGFLSLERVDRARRPIGAGWFDIRGGRLYKLPLLLAVFNLLRLASPDEAAIDTAQGEFRVEQDRIQVERLAVISPVLSLCGDGALYYDGDRVDMSFVPRAGRGGDEELPLPDSDPQVIADFLKKNLLVSVEVRGTWTEPTATVLPLRVVTKPFVDLMRLFKKKK